MFFFAFGSLLFVGAMIAAISVMAADVAHYRRAMMTALRALSLDGLTHTPVRQSTQINRTVSKAMTPLQGAA